MTRRLAVPIVAATMLAGGVVPGQAAVQPPAGIPDLGAMALTAADLPAGAVVRRQGYVRGDPGSRAAYVADFGYRRRAMRSARLLRIRSSVELYRDSSDTLGDLILARAFLSGGGLRKEVGREIARSEGLPTRHLTVGRQRNLHMGDGALALPMTVVRGHRRLAFVASFMVLGRVEAEVDVAAAPGVRHVLHRTRSLLALVRDRTRRALLPASTSPPTITGTAVLHADTGGWSDATKPTSFGYQWQRCDAAGAGCVSIPGAKGPYYAVTANDAGSTLRVLVIARNDVGYAIAASTPVAG